VSADGKPPSPSSPGRPPADTPQRIGVGSESMGLGDTGVASSANAVDQRTTPTLAASDDDVQAKSKPHASEIIGSTLSGRYLVTKKIGQGGMGAVYEATHTLIGKRVAVKVLLEKYAEREAIVARLKKEAQLASSIGNEHIIDITDIGNTDDGRTFVVMEYLEGESLAECLSREHELPEQRILRIASQAASALAAAHAKGIVHRDIKPENLFLLKRKEQDFVKVVDFGISKSLRASGPGEDEEAQRLTQTGMVLGTPLYMSPEQARGDDDLDHRVDIYALGVIMYESIAGRVPFVGSNYLSVISQVLNEVPKPLREIRPDVSEELEAIVAKAMAKNRNDRYRDADAMLEDLGALSADPTHSTERARITGPRRRFPKAPAIPRAAWAVGGLGVVIAGVTLAVVYLQGNGGKDGRKQKAMDELAAKQLRDAGVPAVTPPLDALAEPAYKRITLHINTVPAGAELERESETLGKAPQSVVFVLRDKEVEVTAHLDGYLDASESVNPVEHADGDTITLKLKKLPKGVPQPPRLVPKSGSAAAQPNHTAGGELGGYPGGIVPNK
jgi:tRNA A-37 threonylcarbamoyl transferase component Bud32